MISRLPDIIKDKVKDLNNTLFYQIHKQFADHYYKNTPRDDMEDCDYRKLPFPESIAQPLYNLFNKFGDIVYKHMDKLDNYNLQESTTIVKETFTIFRKPLFEKEFSFPLQKKGEKLNDFFKRCFIVAIKQLCKKFKSSFKLTMHHLKKIAKPRRSVTSAMTEEDNIPLEIRLNQLRTR